MDGKMGPTDGDLICIAVVFAFLVIVVWEVGKAIFQTLIQECADTIASLKREAYYLNVRGDYREQEITTLKTRLRDEEKSNSELLSMVGRLKNLIEREAEEGK